MAKITVLKKGNTESINGWTSKMYSQKKKDGGIATRLTFTNDYMSVKSNYVNENKTFFMLPNTVVDKEDGDSRSYENLKLSDSTKQAILLYGGEYKALCDRTPDLDNYEVTVSDQVSEKMQSVGIVGKISLKGSDWEVPNICVFKDGAGEVSIATPRGVRLHPLVELDIIKTLNCVFEDIETGVTDEVEHLERQLDEDISEEDLSEIGL